MVYCAQPEHVGLGPPSRRRPQSGKLHGKVMQNKANFRRAQLTVKLVTQRG